MPNFISDCGAGSQVKSLERLIQRHVEDSRGSIPIDPASVIERERILRSLRMELCNMVSALGSTIDEADSIVDASRRFSGLDPGYAVSPESILSYSYNLRYTTFAHVGLISQPPAPQQAQMCNSALFRYSHSHAADVQPNVTLKETDNPSIAASSSIPAYMDMDIPSGWKPGDPLPSFSSIQGVPDMPAGWKPGDPIPGLDNSALSVAQQASLPPTASMAQPERLSFILNPDYEVSEESMEESSEEDEW
jgi:hypothetical protein